MLIKNNDYDIICRHWCILFRDKDQTGNVMFPVEIICMIQDYAYSEIPCLIGQSKDEESDFIFVRIFRNYKIWFVVAFEIDEEQGSDDAILEVYEKISRNVWNR